MSLTDDLVSIERDLWTGGADIYLSRVDEECLLAFAEMSGVLTRREVADSVEGAPRWSEVEIEVEGVLRPTDDVAVLTYRARALRKDQAHRSLVSSGYVRRPGGWKLAFHQQTPLEDQG